MDEIDQEILQLLISNSRMSVKEISKRVLLSEPSVKNRIDKLVDKGVIKSYTIQVDLKKMGWDISFIIKISNLKIPIRQLEVLLDKYANLTEVHAVTGNENYIVRGYSKSVTELDVLLNELMPFGSIHTSIILETPIERQLEIF